MSNELKDIKEFKPTTWAINNSTAIYVFTVLICIIGVLVFNKLPKEQFPDIVVPTVSIASIYPGANPQDIENVVTIPIEKQLKSVTGVKKVTSQSLQDLSLIVVEFTTRTEVALAKQRIKDAVDKIKGKLPKDLLNEPQIQEFNFSEFPIMNINVAGDYPLHQLKKYAEKLKDKIETFPQITRLDIIGGLEREITVEVDMYRMQSAGITFGDIERSVKAENVNISGGEITVDAVRRNMRISGEFQNVKDMENVIVKSTTGNLIYLKDIATVKDTYKEKQNFARLDGKPVITMNVIKKAGANLLEGAHNIKDVIAEYQSTELPEGVNISITGDTSIKTETQINDLVNTVIIGFSLVLFILMFFMGLKSAFFVALAVPISSLIGILFMPTLDFTFNVIVIFSLLLALGIIVDDAIVVIENTHRIYHHYDVSIVEAAKAAAGEVFVPVLAGTLTTIAPFFPLLLWPGVVGKFMRYLPITLILTLFASLFVAFIMNPVFAVTFMKKDEEENKFHWKDIVIPFSIVAIISMVSYYFDNIGLTNFGLLMLVLIVLYFVVFKPLIFIFQNKVWPRFIGGYKRFIRFTLKSVGPYLIILLVIVSFFGSIIFFGASNPKIEFFSSAEPNFAYVYCKFPVGTDGLYTDSVTKEMENRVYEIIGKDNPNIESVISNVGIGAGDPRNPDRVVTPHKSKISIAFVDFSKRQPSFSTTNCLNQVREKMQGIPGAEVSVEKEASGPPTGKPLNVEIAGDDFAVLLDLEQKVKTAIQNNNVQGLEELRSDLQRTKPEIIVEINTQKALAQGILKAQAGMELRTALFGKEISKYRDIDEEIPIQLRVDERYRKNIANLLNLNISFFDMSVGQFRQIPLSAIAEIKYTQAFSGINRKNQHRVLNLSSDLQTGYTANEVVGEIDNLIKQLDIPDGYTVRMTGEQEDQKETQDFLGTAFGGAFILMFLILVTQFNSFVKPFIIVSTVLFSLIGVFIGYGATGMGFSIVMTGVGIFSLAGIVIRNGIIMVEFIDELMHRGLELKEAIIEAASIRLTPVLLTACATMLGLVPLAIGLNIDFVKMFTELNPEFYLGGDNVAFWGPLAWTMIFGLLTATCLTLIVVPSMYLIYGSAKIYFKNQNQNQNQNKNQTTHPLSS